MTIFRSHHTLLILDILQHEDSDESDHGSTLSVQSGALKLIFIQYSLKLVVCTYISCITNGVALQVFDRYFL